MSRFPLFVVFSFKKVSANLIHQKRLTPTETHNHLYFLFIVFREKKFVFFIFIGIIFVNFVI